MSQLNYTDEVNYLIKTIDIALESIKKFPPKNFNNKHISQVVETYLDFKNMVVNPQPQHKNLTSLRYLKENIFTYFQEGSGEAVNYFWEKIKEHQLPYKRENKMVKVLKRKKIKSQMEYNFIIDVLVPYKQEGLIKEDEVILLNKLIEEFEQNLKQKK